MRQFVLKLTPWHGGQSGDRGGSPCPGSNAASHEMSPPRPRSFMIGRMALVAFLRGANGGGHRRFRTGVLASPSDVVRFVSIRSRSGPVRASLAVVFPPRRSAANVSHCEVRPAGVDVSASIAVNPPRPLVS